MYGWLSCGAARATRFVCGELRRLTFCAVLLRGRLIYRRSCAFRTAFSRVLFVQTVQAADFAVVKWRFCTTSLSYLRCQISSYQVKPERQRPTTQTLRTSPRPASAIAALGRHVVLSANITCRLFTGPRVPPVTFMEGLSRGWRIWLFRCAWWFRGRDHAHLHSAATAGRGGGGGDASRLRPTPQRRGGVKLSLAH